MNIITYIYTNKQKRSKMLVSKTIKEMDKEFAQAEGLSYRQFMALSLSERYEIKRKITNKRLKK